MAWTSSDDEDPDYTAVLDRAEEQRSSTRRAFMDALVRPISARSGLGGGRKSRLMLASREGAGDRAAATTPLNVSILSRPSTSLGGGPREPADLPDDDNDRDHHHGDEHLLPDPAAWGTVAVPIGTGNGGGGGGPGAVLSRAPDDVELGSRAGAGGGSDPVASSSPPPPPGKTRSMLRAVARVTGLTELNHMFGVFRRRPDEVEEGAEYRLPIPPALLERNFEVPLQPRSELPMPEVMLVIVSYLPAEREVLFNAGLVCRAWYERVLYCPQWTVLVRGVLERVDTAGKRSALHGVLVREMQRRSQERAALRAAAMEPELIIGEEPSSYRRPSEDIFGVLPPGWMDRTPDAEAADDAADADPAPGPDPDPAAAAAADGAEAPAPPTPLAELLEGGEYATRDDFVDMHYQWQQCNAYHSARPYSQTRIKFGLWSTLWAFIIMFGTFISAFLIGYTRNAIDTDPKVATCVFFSGFGLMYVFTMFIYPLRGRLSGTHFEQERMAVLAALVLSALVICPVVGLLSIRITALQDLQALPVYDANRPCSPLPFDPSPEAVALSFSTTSPVASAIRSDPVPSIRFEGGTRGFWYWEPATKPTIVTLTSTVRRSSGRNKVRTVTVQYPVHVFFASRNESMVSGSGSSPFGTAACPLATNTSWRLAFSVPATITDAVTGLPRNYTLQDLPTDPLTAFRTRTLQLYVPFDSEYFSFFNSFEDTVALAWRFSTQWTVRRTLLIPVFGSHSLTDDGQELPSYADLEASHTRGVILLGLGPIVLFIAVIATVFTRQTALRTRIAKAVFFGALAVCNGPMVALWGAICQTQSPTLVCMMDDSAPIGMFIVSVFITIYQASAIKQLLC